MHPWCVLVQEHGLRIVSGVANRTASSACEMDRQERFGLRHLPSYSPDLNPIEQFFSKLKALLRQAAERTIPNLWRRIHLLLRTVCPEECANFLRHAGYVST